MSFYITALVMCPCYDKQIKYSMNGENRTHLSPPHEHVLPPLLLTAALSNNSCFSQEQCTLLMLNIGKVCNNVLFTAWIGCRLKCTSLTGIWPKQHGNVFNVLSDLDLAVCPPRSHWTRSRFNKHGSKCTQSASPSDCCRSETDMSLICKNIHLCCVFRAEKKLCRWVMPRFKIFKEPDHRMLFTTFEKISNCSGWDVS